MSANRNAVAHGTVTTTLLLTFLTFVIACIITLLVVWFITWFGMPLTPWGNMSINQMGGYIILIALVAFVVGAVVVYSIMNRTIMSRRNETSGWLETLLRGG